MAINKDFISFFTNLSKHMNNVDKRVNSITKNIERRINWQIRRIKKEIMSTFFLIIFLSLTMLFLSAGLIVFLYRFFPLDIILLGFGLLFALMALLVKAVS